MDRTFKYVVIRLIEFLLEFIVHLRWSGAMLVQMTQSKHHSKETRYIQRYRFVG